MLFLVVSCELLLSIVAGTGGCGQLQEKLSWVVEGGGAKYGAGGKNKGGVEVCVCWPAGGGGGG